MRHIKRCLEEVFMAAKVGDGVGQVTQTLALRVQLVLGIEPTLAHGNSCSSSAVVVDDHLGRGLEKPLR